MFEKFLHNKKQNRSKMETKKIIEEEEDEDELEDEESKGSDEDRLSLISHFEHLS